MKIYHQLDGHLANHLIVLLYPSSPAVSSMAFNIDEANPKIIKGEEKDFFGYKVLQFISGKEKGQVLLLS
jgi:hypothetical protein